MSREATGEEDPTEEKGERPKKVRASTEKVTKAMRDEHELTHTPYAWWCRHCVRGRGKNKAHERKKRRDEEYERNKVPRISLDYFYMSQQDEEANKNPLLVVVDEKSGEKYARATGKKGIGTEGEMTWLIKDLSEEIKTWGHMGGEGGKVILKCDGEPAMKAVRDALGRYHGGVIIPEEPAVNESQSN